MDAREAADDGAGSEPESAMPRGAGDQFDTPCDASPDAISDVDVPGGGQVCAICLVDGRDDADAAATWKQTPCGHRFHGWCLEKWLGKHDTCPMCRHHVTPPPVSRASSQNMDVDDEALAYDSSDDDSYDSSDFYSSDDDSFDSSDDSSGAEDADGDEQEVAGGAQDTNEDAAPAAPVESMDDVD